MHKILSTCLLDRKTIWGTQYLEHAAGGEKEDSHRQEEQNLKNLLTDCLRIFENFTVDSADLADT